MHANPKGDHIHTATPSAGYAVVAQTYRDCGFAPIPIKGKGRQDDGSGGLPKGATGHAGEVTDEKIAEWSASPFWRDENVALRAEGWIGIDVDAYDDKHGDETLVALEAELGELPVTISSTSRGPDQPSRIDFFRIPDGYNRFVTKFTDLEIIQRGHRYAVVAPSVHPRTGETYAWYDFDGQPLDGYPNLDDLEWLPQAWLDRLSIPDIDVTPETGYSGSTADWMAGVPSGGMGLFMEARVREIPAEPFGHDVMISLMASMVSLASRGEPGGPEALAALRREWLRGEYDTEEYRAGFDSALETAIKKFGSMPDRAEDILATDQVQAFTKIAHAGFLDLWTSLPRTITEESLHERVARIMSIAYDEGLKPLEAASLGWHSAAAQHALGPRQHGVEAVWALAQDVAKSPVATERDFALEPVVVAPPEAAPKRAVELMTEAERARRSSITWWGDEFMTAMASVNPVMCESYYRLNRWMILSISFADRAVIPRRNGEDLILNFYGLMPGPSHTGKTEAMAPVRAMASAMWPIDSNPDIGAEATSSGLTQALIRRDGLPSLLAIDEAHVTLRQWADSTGPYHAMAGRITAIYTGRVPALQLATQKDISGIHAKAYLNVHLSGIEDEIYDAINPGDWVTGFINRFVWAVGEKKKRTDEQRKFPILREGQSKDIGAQSWYLAWCARFNSIRDNVLAREPGEGPKWIDMADDVINRDVLIQKQFEAMAAASSYGDRIGPTFDRLHGTILKCAALVALTNKRRRIEMDDYLIALEQAEEWAENILHAVEATDETPRARQVNKLYELIENKGGRMSEREIKRRKNYAGDAKYVQGLLTELREQGRVELLPLADGNVYRVVKEES